MAEELVPWYFFYFYQVLEFECSISNLQYYYFNFSTYKGGCGKNYIKKIFREKDFDNDAI